MHTNDSLVGSRPEVIAPFLKKLFNAYTEASLSWAVMRGWEHLPYWTRYDVDILIARADYVKASSVLRSIAEQTGWRIYGTLKMGAMCSFWMLQDSEQGQSYLRIDLETGNQYRGIEIHESQCYLKDRVWSEVQGLWHMPLGYAAAAVLLKEMAVRDGVLTDKRKSQISAGHRDPMFKTIISEALDDEPLSEELLKLLDSADWAGVANLGRKIRHRIFRKTPTNIIRMIVYSFYLIKSMVCPFMRCLIVIVGPDGCGKTTIADAVEKRFRGRPFQSLLRVHMLFGVPRMRSIKAFLYRCIGMSLAPQKEEAPGTMHMGMQPPHSILKSLAYVTYYGFGMIIGRLKLFLWRTQGGLVLADRFFQDYYYMRGYMNCPRWYIRLMEFFAPKPDLIISLERPAEDIYSQKPELSIDEIRREQFVIRECLANRKNTRIIDASHGLEPTIRAVISEVENWIEYGNA